MKKGLLIAAALLGAALVSAAADSGPQYKGNPDSKIFHKSGCRYSTNANCTAVFSTREAAAGAGYAPCKVCKP